MLTQDQIQALKAPFPEVALSADTSRGFELTSIKAAYVIERLNEVFGPCGFGWRYAHSPFEACDLKNGSQEIITEVAFQYRGDGENGCPRAEWCALTKDWGWHESSPATWSEPIFACGGKAVVKGGAPHTDARKSAVTDGLTKAASMLGVGHTVFKGLVRAGNGQRPVERKGNGNGRHPAAQLNPAPPGNGSGKQPASTQSPASQPTTPPTRQAPVITNPKNGVQTPPPIKEEADATTFWMLYNREAKPVGVSQEEAQTLVFNDNWGTACANLRVLIAKAHQPVAARN